jgi:hypothetical protein
MNELTKQMIQEQAQPIGDKKLTLPEDLTPAQVKAIQKEIRRRFRVRKPRKPEPVGRQALIARQKKARPYLTIITPV